MNGKWIQLWILFLFYLHIVSVLCNFCSARTYGMMGFAVASLGANSLRVAAVVILGIVKQEG